MKFLRRALEADINENDDLDKKTIVVKGPLSEVYTKALHVAYAKDPAESDGDENVVLEAISNTSNRGGSALRRALVSMETQQTDSAIVERLARTLNGMGDITPTNNTTLYAVSKNELTDQTVVDITSELVEADDSDRVFLIIDGTLPGDNGNASSPIERVSELSAVIESLAEKHKCRVFYSLQDAVRHM